MNTPLLLSLLDPTLPEPLVLEETDSTNRRARPTGSWCWPCTRPPAGAGWTGAFTRRRADFISA